MNRMIEPRVPRGMRDMLPESMIKRQYVIDTIREVFETFGFEPLSTPVIELEETLKGKYGPEAERLFYGASYPQGEEKLSLRYDLSVPLCRVIAQYPDLPKPFKRYQIAPLWRAEKPQRGRYREFFQCDVDTVGSASMQADAEMVAVLYAALTRLGFKKFTTHINSRKILKGIGQFAGVPQELMTGMFQAIDKLPKIGVQGVRQELLSVSLPDPVFDCLRRVARLYLQGKLTLEETSQRLRAETLPAETTGAPSPFPEVVAIAAGPALVEILAKEKPGEVDPDRVQEAAGHLVQGLTPLLRDLYRPTRGLIPDAVVDQVLSLIHNEGNNQATLQSLRKRLGDFPEVVEGVDELEQILRYLRLLGVPDDFITIDSSLVRGLDYYTGPVYETIIEEAGIGSVAGGGRYDRMVGLFTNTSLPATGISLGFDRIVVVMEEQGMFPASLGKTVPQVLVTLFNRDCADESISTALMLREAGLRTQVYFDPDPLREQIGYAVKKGIPVLLIAGPDELAQGKLAVRDLRLKRQELVPIEDTAEWIKKLLA
jgi:histidyl-tRNA synthetase